MHSDPSGQPGPGGYAGLGGPPPEQRHWWSIQPPPQVSPISAGRAYTEVLLVFGAFFAASIIDAGESLGGRLAAPAGSWARFIPAAVNELTYAGIAALVVVLLSARRGITPRLLGFGLPRAASGRPAFGQTTRIAAWALLGQLIGALITIRLATGGLDQPAHLNNAYFAWTAAASLSAGVLEEVLVLAFVLTTLRQAKRPLPEIVIVAVLLRCSYHIYYGPGVIGIAVWAAIFVWIFLRGGSLIPLIIVHFLWDLILFLQQKWHVVATVGVVYVVVLLLTAVISWPVDAARRRAQRAALAAYTLPPQPGWGGPPVAAPYGLAPGGPPLYGPPPVGPPLGGPPPANPAAGFPPLAGPQIDSPALGDPPAGDVLPGGSA